MNLLNNTAVPAYHNCLYGPIMKEPLIRLPLLAPLFTHRLLISGCVGGVLAAIATSIPCPLFFMLGPNLLESTEEICALLFQICLWLIARALGPLISLLSDVLNVLLFQIMLRTASMANKAWLVLGVSRARPSVARWWWGKTTVTVTVREEELKMVRRWNMERG